MGSYNSTNKPAYTPYNSPVINRMPIPTPRHVPESIGYENTPYSKFDPELYRSKFTYPNKEEPKYW